MIKFTLSIKKIRQCAFYAWQIELERRNEINIIAWRKRLMKYQATGGWIMHQESCERPFNMRNRGLI